MPSPSERTQEAGRALRDRLKKEGRNFDAQVVQNMIQSMQGSNSTLKQLHRDNMELRRQRAVELEITGQIS